MKKGEIGLDGTLTVTEIDTGDPDWVNLEDIDLIMSPEEQELFWAKHTRMEISHYRNARALQYPDIGDQLDDLFKQGAFSEEMAAKIQAVKDENPKPVDE